MRTVLYASSDMEPITVIDVPDWAAKSLRHGEHIHFAIVEPVLSTAPVAGNRMESVHMPAVTVWAEKFARHGRVHFFLFTDDEVNALLMESEFLPGQQAELARMRKQAFVDGMLAAISRLP